LRLYINAQEVGSTAFSGAFGAPDADAEMVIGDGTIVSGNREFDEVAFYRTGLAADRVLAHYQAGAVRGFARSQFPGARIGAILDTVNSHAPRRLGAGTRALTGSFTTGQDPLGEIREAVRGDAVDAFVFIARDGAVAFLVAGHRAASPYNTVQATFDDDDTDLPYLEIDVDYSDSFLVNEWNVTRTEGTTQTASDVASKASYDERPQSITDVPVTSDAATSAIAAAMLAKTKDAMQRVTRLDPNMADITVLESMLRRDIGDRIRVFRTPLGGGARIDQNVFIQKYELSGVPGRPWDLKLSVSPL
jgi:hypothetical protein